MNIKADDVKKLREATGAGMMDAKKALQEAGGFDQAVIALRKKGHVVLEKKSDRPTGQGLIASYIHAGDRIGVLLEVNCETDFVARNEEFKKLVNELALQITSTAPDDVAGLLVQDYIREPSKKIKDLIAETVSKLGENIQVRRFTRFVLGSD